MSQTKGSTREDNGEGGTVMKKKALLFAITGIGYAILLLIMGYDMGRKKVERMGHLYRLARLSMIVGFLDGIRTGDVATAESRLRVVGYLEATALLKNEYWENDSLISPLAKELLEIGKAIPSAEKTAAEERYESRMKRKMQESGKELSGGS
jgi:hypothetical protein